MPGQIPLESVSKINGIRCCCHIWSAVCDHLQLHETRFDEYFELPAFCLSACYDAYLGGLDSLCVRPEKAYETLAEDVPLCPLNKVEAAVAAEIDAGHIRKVYELQFGYALYNEPGVFRESMGEPCPTTPCVYYQQPVWLINSLYVRTPTAMSRTCTDDQNTATAKQPGLLPLVWTRRRANWCGKATQKTAANTRVSSAGATPAANRRRVSRPQTTGGSAFPKENRSAFE
jgi:hypothetical protein